MGKFVEPVTLRDQFERCVRSPEVEHGVGEELVQCTQRYVVEESDNLGRFTSDVSGEDISLTVSSVEARELFKPR